LEIIYKSPSELKPFQKNPYNHSEKQLTMLKKSMREFGFTSPILISQDNMVIAGHARLKAAQEIGLSKVPTIFIDLPYEKAVAYVIADNQLAKLAEEDRDLLGELLQGINDIPDFDIEAVGFSSEDIDTLLKSGEPVEVVEDEFNPDEVGEGRCKEGDLWQLGRHFLLCGDSTKRENIERLLNGVKIDLVFTDPPYGIDVVNEDKVGISAKVGFGTVGTAGIVKAKKYKKIIGDDKPYDPSHLMGLSGKLILWGANNYSSRLPDNSHWIVWDKKAEKGADHNNFSDCELAWTNIPKKSVVIYRYLWSGLLREGDRNTELSERVHPTQKPVGLLADILNDYSSDEDKILDLFLGSGSTLIACEQLNRTLYGCELSPEYCDVIISRWEQFTNQTAKKLN
jgi:DNA modification methylase